MPAVIFAVSSIIFSIIWRKVYKIEKNPAKWVVSTVLTFVILSIAFYLYLVFSAITKPL